MIILSADKKIALVMRMENYHKKYKSPSSYGLNVVTNAMCKSKFKKLISYQ